MPDVEKLIAGLLELVGREGIEPPVENGLTAGNLGGILARHGVTLAYLFGSSTQFMPSGSW